MALLKTKGTGVSAELYLLMDNATKDGIAVSVRQIRPDGVPELLFAHMTYNEAGQRAAKIFHAVTTTANSERGRLRVARQGAMFVASSADGDEEEFQLIVRCIVGTEDIAMIRLAGMSGGDPKAVLDMRFVDFRLQTGNVDEKLAVKPTKICRHPGEGLPSHPAENAPRHGARPPDEEGEDPASEGSSNRIVWGTMIAVLALLLCFLAVGLLFMWRRSRRKSTTEIAETKPRGRNGSRIIRRSRRHRPRFPSVVQDARSASG